MTKVLILSCFFICYLQSVYCICTAPKTPNINKLANYINAWKETHICNKKANVEAIIDSTGRWYITSKIPVTETEDTKSLCNCMKEFLFQSSWTKSASSICLYECTTVTLLIIGRPDPTFIGKKSVLESQNPIISLAEVFGQYPNADLGGQKQCTSTSGKNKDGLLQVTFSCNLKKTDNLNLVCKNIYKYVNAGNFLSKTTTNTCNAKNEKVVVDVIAKKNC